MKLIYNNVKTELINNIKFLKITKYCCHFEVIEKNIRCHVNGLGLGMKLFFLSSKNSHFDRFVNIHLKIA